MSGEPVAISSVSKGDVIRVHMDGGYRDVRVLSASEPDEMGQIAFEVEPA